MHRANEKGEGHSGRLETLSNDSVKFMMKISIPLSKEV